MEVDGGRGLEVLAGVEEDEGVVLGARVAEESGVEEVGQKGKGREME